MELLKEKYCIPELPGVYLMKDRDRVIYIGKAKNLKKRVLSYFNKNHNDKKTIELVAHIVDFEFIVCKSELDALILENNLIKKYMPKYNILLKDQKTYPYIRITKEKFAQISIIHRTKDINYKNADYFGPFPNGINFILKITVKIFKIRNCKKDMKKQYLKPCLKHHIGLCLAPCVYKDIEKIYAQNVENSKYFLNGKCKLVINKLKNSMQKFSTSMNFESAIKYRDQILALSNSLKTQVTEVLKDIDEDIFVYKINGDILFLTILKIRHGTIIGINNLKLNVVIEDDILVESFLRYYSNEKTPRNIILDRQFIEKKELLESWVKEYWKRSIKIIFPVVKSRRKKLLETAYLNLEEEIKKHSNQKHILETGIKNLYNILYLKKIPRKIECFDISNIVGKDAVGSMSVAIEGRMTKKQYRKFRIKTKDTPDDYHMLREVITRRYSKLNEADFPELILIDGGIGQLNSVIKTLEDINKIELVDVISIAKKEEEVFTADHVSHILKKSSEELKILQRLRDEAHRFGINYHRILRKKRVISSELDSINGIGPKRKKELLLKFHSVRKIKLASLEELELIIPTNIAKKIKQMDL